VVVVVGDKVVVVVVWAGVVVLGEVGAECGADADPQAVATSAMPTTQNARAREADEPRYPSVEERSIDRRVITPRSIDTTVPQPAGPVACPRHGLRREIRSG